MKLHTYSERTPISKVWRDGLPITAPPRTLADVAGRIQPEQLQMAIRQALLRGLLTEEELREEAVRRRKRAVLDALADGGESP